MEQTKTECCSKQATARWRALGGGKSFSAGTRGSGNAVKSGGKEEQARALGRAGVARGLGSGRRAGRGGLHAGARGGVPRGRGWRAAGSGGLRPGEGRGAERRPRVFRSPALPGAPGLVCGPGAGRRLLGRPAVAPAAAKCSVP